MLRLTLMLIIAVLLADAKAISQDKPEVLFDPPPTEGMLDLAKTPLWVDILRQAGLALRDKALSDAFTRDFNSVRDGINKEIGKTKLGYLLKVEVYTTEDGTPIVPAGQIVFPIGVGTQPIDALAEFLREPVLRVPPPGNAINESYYIWIKNRDGKLAGGMVPREFRQTLEKDSKDEADRRNALGEWRKALPNGTVIGIKRAEYWTDVASKYSEYIESEGRRNTVRQLTSEFASAEKRFNEAYQKYRETEAKMIEVANYNKTLDGIAKVTNLVSQAVQTGAMVCSINSNPPRTDGEAVNSMQATIDYTTTEYNALSADWKQTKIHLELEGKQLQQLNDSLRKNYQDANIPIPRAEDTLPLPKP